MKNNFKDKFYFREKLPTFHNFKIPPARLRYSRKNSNAELNSVYASEFEQKRASHAAERKHEPHTLTSDDTAQGEMGELIKWQWATKPVHKTLSLDRIFPRVNSGSDRPFAVPPAARRSLAAELDAVECIS